MTERNKREEVDTERTVNRDWAFLLNEAWWFLLTEDWAIIELEQSEKPKDTERTTRVLPA